ncbi:MAG: transglutaminase domain-containing protein [Spirochaetales bacterium]
MSDYAAREASMKLRMKGSRAWILVAAALFLGGLITVGAQPLHDSRGAEIDFSAIDAYVAALPKFDSPALVAAHLRLAAKNEWEMARALYDWVCLNIAYDTNAYFSGIQGDVSAESTFLTGKSVCSGYAGLTLELAKLVGLEAVSIDGYAKGYGYSAGETLSKNNHAWNAFRIDGEWRLMDTTWGAGAIDENRRFRKRLSHAWFAMDPQLYFCTHCPEEASWSLLGAKSTKADFEKLVFVDSYVFDALYAQGLGASFQKKLITRFGSKLGDIAWMVGKLAEAGFSESEILGSLEGDVPDNLLIGVLALKRYGFANADLVAYLRSGKAPKAFKSDIDLKVLDVPVAPVLKLGDTYYFRVRASGVAAAAVICGKQFSFLRKEGEFFSGRVKITAGPVKLSFSESGGAAEIFHATFEYEVAD